MDRLPVCSESLESRRLLHGAPHDPAMMDEHLAMLALVPDEAVTHAAVRSGAWSEPSTWRGGVAPAAEANVLVPPEVTVTVDRVDPAALRTVRVDGTLTFATAVDTQLTVDTLVVTPEGALAIGTESDPLKPDVTARVVFTDRGPIDTEWDPRLLSRGLIAHGSTSIYGSAKKPFAALAVPARKGAATLALAEAPAGWRVGDKLVLPGTSPAANQDETLTIIGISGRFVRIDRALAFNHAAPQPDLPVYVADLTRNVVFTSENTRPGRDNVARRGHVMFMHSPAADVNHAAFEHVGRTDKSMRINDARLDDFNRLVPGTGANVRGRYAVHFHRTGVDNGVDGAETPAAVRGSVVDDSAGWGFVNHSSDVVFEDNVSHDVFGAGFVAEAGDEAGAFRHNFALRSTGTDELPDARGDVQDFGQAGHGFWFQGPGTEVEGNVAAGQHGAAFMYFTQGLVQAGVGTTRFPAANLPDASIAGGAEWMDVGDVPIRLFRDNYAFASGDGFESWFHLLNARHSGRSVVEGMTTWAARSGKAVSIPYTRNMTLRNLRALGSLRAPAGLGVASNHRTASIQFDDARIEGFDIGIDMPQSGDNRVRGGAMNNLRSVYLTPAAQSGRTTNVTVVRFGYLPPAGLAGRRQYDVYFQREDARNPYSTPAQPFADDTVRLNDRQVYRAEQAADYVPFPGYDGSGRPGGAAPPPELVGKTNRQLWDQYGLAVGGAVAPGDVVRTGRPRTNGLVGSAATPLPALTLASRRYTNRLTDYQLVFTTASGNTIRHPRPADLREGWNLVTRTAGGHPRTFFVYGDVTAPTVVPTGPAAINPLALPRGITLRVLVRDDSIGDVFVTRTYADLPARPVRTRPDGTRFIPLEFTTTDVAGNPVSALLELTLDPAAPL